MAFFGSKSCERELKRTYSTDRLRREREHANETRSRSISHGEGHGRTQHIPRALRTQTRKEPTVDEFGVVCDGKGDDKEDPPSLTFSTTSKSASLPAEPASPIIAASLFVPHHSGVSGPSSSSSSLHKQTTRMRTATGTGSGSKHSSHSSNPSRKRVPPPDVDRASSSDAVVSMRPSSRASGHKREEAVVRAHSPSNLKVEPVAPRSRSKTSLRAQAVAGGVPTRDRIQTELFSSAPSLSRPSRNARPLDSQTSSPRPSPSPSINGVAASTQKHDHSPASQSNSSPSSSPFSLSSRNCAQVRQRSSPSSTPGPASTSASRREDSSLAIPPNSNSNTSSVSKKPSCGNASDSSYGSPFASEFGATFNVKRLLSKPAASSAGTGGVRSEPDMNADTYDLYGSYALAARRRRVEGRNNAPTPSSVYSVMEGTMSPILRDHSRRPTTADPEPPGGGVGSLGRARGLEWGHVLNREREEELELERGNAHVRDGSSYSFSSPSEGVTGYPYGRASERGHERRANKSTRPLIQLTTSAVKRLSALGAREADRGYERDRSNSPITPMTFGPAPSPGSANLSATPSPLTSMNAWSRGTPGQPSPTSTSVVVPRTESPKPPVGLTPAEIVAHAYKEQERRRAELEREAARETEIPEKIHSSEREREKSQRTIRVKDKGRGKVLSRSASANAASSYTNFDSTSSNQGDISPVGEPPTPYYTVFGEPTGRTVAIGSARDSAFGLFDRAHERVAEATEKAVISELSLKASSGSSATVSGEAVSAAGAEEKTGSSLLRRKLSRKVSGKFKRDGSFARGGGRVGGKESSDGRDWKDDFGELLSGGSEDLFSTDGHLRSRPSLTLNISPASGRRSATLPREKNGAHHQPLKMSMDSFVAVQSTESGTGRALPSAANGARSRARDEKEKDKNKLWGLMKRISSTTLKDKYKRASVEIVPPVPALPRDFSSTSNSPTYGVEREKEKDGIEVTYARKLSTRPSLSHMQRPSTAPAFNLNETGNEGRFATLRKKPSVAEIQAQAPGATSLTQDNAMSSEGSPTTSYGDTTLVNGKLTSKPVLGQHILPPETLYLFDDFNVDFERKDDDTKSKLDSRDARSTIVDGYDGLFYVEEPTSHQALPVPPRRAPQSKADADDLRSESPTIPSFSAENAINTFGYRKRAGTNTGASVSSAFTGVDFGPSESASSSLSCAPSEPPPRPPRSARRGPPATPSTIQSSHNSHSPPSSIARVVFEDRTGRASIGALSQASTARPSMLRSSPCSTPSPPPELLDSQSPVSASDSASSTMTFRDMNGMGLKPVWSEKEKIDKWNDLLDRSERAGGTLHVGVGGLLSDHIRESAYEPIRDPLYSDF